VRLDESQSRRANIEKRQNIVDSNLTPHNTLTGAFVYQKCRKPASLQVGDVAAYSAQPRF
ncbi:MAG: hypothetical protein WCJ11_12780, partial [Methylococcaceae bacterium]